MLSIRTLPLGASAVALALACLAAPAAQAAIVFEPLGASATLGSLPAATPFVLPANWQQRTLFTNQENGLWRAGANRTGNSNFDMIVQNETGPNAGRFLFTVNESTGGGLVRYDSLTDTPVQLLEGGLNGTSFRSLDPVRWTPWGTVIMGEETTNGRLIEIANPLAQPGSIVAIDRPNAGRSSWEGIAWDQQGNMYYQDENNNGGIYKFVPNNKIEDYDPNDPSTSPLAGTGQIFTLRVNASNTEQREGVAEWVALNNPDGSPIPGITDPTVSARQAGDDVNATNYRRPEDLHLVVRDGVEYLIVAATTADSGTSPGRHHVYSVDLSNAQAPQVRSFVDDRITIDLATGLPIDSMTDAFINPDNIAIDAFGDVWIVEDNGPGDIWKATWGANGTAASVARFASLSSLGAEPTGLYFDINNPYKMYVNVQHPSDGIDRMIEISASGPVPEPATWAMLIVGMGAIGASMRVRRKSVAFA